MAEDDEDAAFDKIMEIVGNDGKFQFIFNHFYNVALMCFASMSYMNIVMVLNEPNHTCHVPGRDKYNLTEDHWINLTIPKEPDNRGILTTSDCSMYNISKYAQLPPDEWNFTKNDSISCVYGYDYDKTWYERTAVSDQNWVCDDVFYQTNVYVWHGVGEVIGAFLFGQLGDTMGRRPVFYLSIGIIMFSRIMMTVTASYYFLYAIASLISMLTSMSIFMSPYIIAMETSKEEERGKISMLQNIAWTLGMSIMPLVFWAVRDWVWFLMITTLPIGLFAMYSKFMIESPRWLATKRHLERCAVELNRIAKINGKEAIITEKMLKELLPDANVEEVYGVASLFSSWRLAKNTAMLTITWSTAAIVLYVLMLNSSRTGGNPFLSFLYQTAIELPASIAGRYLSDKIGRRISNSVPFLLIGIVSIPTGLVARYTDSHILLTLLIVLIKFLANISYFAINLQAMEIYPTCLRQSGIAISVTAANCLAVVGPYIVFLGTEYDVRYVYFITGGLCFFGFVAGMFLPETLHHKLPNTMREAKLFGSDQKFWSYPKKIKEVTKEDPEVVQLNSIDS